MDRHVVLGRIAAPPEMDAAELLQDIDTATGDAGSCAIYAPDLCEAANDHVRAKVERRRFDLLFHN